MLVGKRSWQRGDTLVEVMIVLAVLGSAIGISYSTASRSLLNARQAQENAMASKIAQTQLEALYVPSKITEPNDDVGNPIQNYLYTDGGTFCMDGSGNRINFPGSVTSATDQREIDYANFPAQCRAQNDLYHYSVRYTADTAATDNDNFTVVVVWDDVLGNGQDTVTLTYRIHKPVPRDDI